MKSIPHKILALALLALALCVPSFAANADVPVGKKVVFTVTLGAGSPPLTYKWQKAPPGSTADAAFTDIVGAPNANVYTIPVAKTSDSGVYRVVVSNQYGTTKSDNGTLTLGAPPSIQEFGITVSEPDPV